MISDKLLARLKETADDIDTVTLDIPLFIRLLEFAREDAKDDMILHTIVENCLRVQKEEGVAILGMSNYDNLVKE